MFLDIRMPGRSGLEAAEAIVEDWPHAGRALPLIVFVTAYDQYALQPSSARRSTTCRSRWQPARLAACCRRLQETLALRRAAASGAAAPSEEDGTLLARLRALLGAPVPAPAGGAAADDPAGGRRRDAAHDPRRRGRLLRGRRQVRPRRHRRPQAPIRMSLRELLPRLDPERFWQVHRGTVIRADAIATATRDDAGRVVLTLRERPERLAASRLYAHRFRGM